MMVAVLALAMLGAGERGEAARRRPLRCCIMVPADDGGARPYCFNLNVHPRRAARRICRAVGGTPLRTEVR
jgi:hypothetical protein